MLRRGIHRIAIALVLAAALLAPPASLAAGPSGFASASPWRLDLGTLWAWAHLWLGIPGPPAPPAPKPVTRKTACDGGGHIAPNGGTGCKAATKDGGLSIDPDGLQTSSPPTGSSSDGGGSIDPNG